MEDLIIILAGAAGALVKDIVQDGCLVLPEKKDGKIVLGFIGGLLIGAFVGYVVDGQPLTAAMAGFTGSSLLAKLVQPTNLINKD